MSRTRLRLLNYLDEKQPIHDIIMSEDHKIIYLYAGQGAASYLLLLEGLKASLKDSPGFKIRTFDSDFVRQTARFDPDKVQAVILPGGARPQYDKTLGPHGFGLIRDFVQNGGIFLGVCAGAYYASKAFEWKPGGLPAVHKKPGLNFFNGLARGPLPNAVDHDKGYDTWYDLSLLTTSLHNKSRPGQDISGQCVYWGGPLFKPQDRPARMETLASIDVAGAQEPAILKIPFGQGQAIVSNIHPEISARHLKAFTRPSVTPPVDERTYLKNIVSRLEANETFRAVVWERMMDEIRRRPVKPPGPHRGAQLS